MEKGVRAQRPKALVTPKQSHCTSGEIASHYDTKPYTNYVKTNSDNHSARFMIQMQYMGLLSLATFNTHIIIKALLDWLLLLLSLLGVARHFNTEANM